MRGLDRLRCRGDADARVAGLDLTVRAGEIVGLFGLLGAGCIEAALAIYGAWPGDSDGEILVDGDESRDRAVPTRRSRSASA